MDDLTYPEVGAGATGQLPDGYDHLRHRERIGHGRAVLEVAGAAVLGRRTHRLAGVRIDADTDEAALCLAVHCAIGVGPLRVGAPNRVPAHRDRARPLRPHLRHPHRPPGRRRGDVPGGDGARQGGLVHRHRVPPPCAAAARLRPSTERAAGRCRTARVPGCPACGDEEPAVPVPTGHGAAELCRACALVLRPCPCGQWHQVVAPLSGSWPGIWRRVHMTDEGTPNPRWPWTG